MLQKHWDLVTAKSTSFIINPAIFRKLLNFLKKEASEKYCFRYTFCRASHPYTPHIEEAHLALFLTPPSWHLINYKQAFWGRGRGSDDQRIVSAGRRLVVTFVTISVSTANARAGFEAMSANCYLVVGEIELKFYLAKKNPSAKRMKGRKGRRGTWTLHSAHPSLLQHLDLLPLGHCSLTESGDD